MSLNTLFYHLAEASENSFWYDHLDDDDGVNEVVTVDVDDNYHDNHDLHAEEGGDYDDRSHTSSYHHDRTLCYCYDDTGDIDHFF